MSTAFVDELRSRCVASPGVIGLADSDDPRIATVTARLLSENSFARVVLFDVALRNGRLHDVDLSVFGPRLQVVKSTEGTTAGRLALAAAMLESGNLDCVLAGNLSTTAEVIRAGIGGVGLAPGVRTVSGSFVMNKPGEGVLLYADCGVVILPTEKQLVDIGIETVRTWQGLFPDVPPVVAYLSYSTRGSAKHETQEKIARAAAMFREACPGVAADGELQFDAAFDPDICARKAPGSPVAGRANCFIFPDLGAGNIAYKITQRLGGYEAYGPVLQGLARPFSDLSRGATVADIVASAYLTRLRGSGGPVLR